MVFLDIPDSSSSPSSDLLDTEIVSTSDNLNVDNFVLVRFKGKNIFHQGKKNPFKNINF